VEDILDFARALGIEVRRDANIDRTLWDRDIIYTVVDTDGS